MILASFRIQKPVLLHDARPTALAWIFHCSSHRSTCSSLSSYDCNDDQAHEARSLPSPITGNDAFSSADGISKNTTEPSNIGIGFTQPAHLPRITPIAIAENDYYLL